MPPRKKSGGGGGGKKGSSPQKSKGSKATQGNQGAQTVDPTLRPFYISGRPITLDDSLGLYNIQSYFPALETLFPSLRSMADPRNAALGSEESIVELPSDSTALVENLKTRVLRKVPIWLRKVHLVNPVDVMEGILLLPEDGSLPSPTLAGGHKDLIDKLNNPLNEAYTDAVCSSLMSRLVETGKSPHFCRFFGTFNARSATYAYNITDDLEDIENERWFLDGIKCGKFKVFAVNLADTEIMDELRTPTPFDLPRTKPLDVSSELSASLDALEIEELDEEEERGEERGDGERYGESEGEGVVERGCRDSIASHVRTPEESEGEGVEREKSDLEEIQGDSEAVEEVFVDRRNNVKINRNRRGDDSGSGSVSRSEGGSDEVSEDESESNSVSSEDIEYRAVLKNFPVQVTCIERCDGTMDALMDLEMSGDPDPGSKEARWTAWIFQVIAGLCVAQQNFEFVHNDLHTNNVVWSATDEPYLYYQIKGSSGGDRVYRVPTFGKIMKIIDFGRATFRPPEARGSGGGSGGSLWISDAYAPDADAGGQYNCEPYLVKGQPVYGPNPSFDLCRLAIAVIDSVWDRPIKEAEKGDGEHHCPVICEPHRVLTQEPGRVQHETNSPLWNLLWLWLTDKEGKNIVWDARDRERYEDFDLYSAIARDSRNAVPSKQLTLPLFDTAFRFDSEVPGDVKIWMLRV